MTPAAAPRVARAAVAGLAGLASIVAGVETVAAQTQPHACELLTEKDARKALGKAVRREADLTGTEASQCSYTATRDAKRVVALAVGEFPSGDQARNAYVRARTEDRFEGLAIENVRRIGDRAHWLPKTNNFTRTVRDRKIAIGELTVLEDRFVYTVYLAPPSEKHARDVLEKVIDRRSR